MMRIASVLLALVVMSITTSSASAYWTATGAGSGTGGAGTLSKPTVTVPSESTGSIHVEWTASHLSPASAEADSQITYEVERSANSGATWADAGGTCASPTGTACDDDVTTSGTYVYRVSAVLNSWTERSDASSAVTRRPAAPDVTGTSGTGTTPSVTGTAEAGSTVKLYTDSSCQTAALDGSGNAGAQGTATGGSFAITATVPAGQTKTFWATATSGSLVSSCSSTSTTYTAPAATAPSPPSGLAAAAQPPASGVAFGKINLTWTAVASATSYDLFRSTTSNPASWGTRVGTTSQPAGGAGATAAFLDTPPAFGTYYYVVRAVNGAGSSANSNQAGPATTKIQPPSNLRVTDQVGNSPKNVKLAWNSPSPVPAGTVLYNLYRSTSSTSGFSAVSGCTGISGLNCNDSSNGRTAGATYHYVVTAYMSGHTASESVFSGVASAVQQ